MNDGATLLSGNTVRPLSEPVRGTVTEDNYPQMVAQVRLAVAQGSMCAVDLRDLAPHRKLSFMRAIHRTSDLNSRASEEISRKITTEELDLAQFGRVLHTRQPQINDNPPKETK